MLPKYKRRALASRYDDCGRTHETSSEASWNSSTIVEYSLPQQSTRKEERTNRYDSPGALQFSDWFRSYKGTYSAAGAESTVSSNSKMETKSWPGTTVSSRKPNSRKLRGTPKQRIPKKESWTRHAMHKKDWNKTTTLTWRNTYKREQFRHIMDARRLPICRNERYKNVRSQYLKPRKRYDVVPPPAKKKKVYKPLVFPLATQCRCDKGSPAPLSPYASPIEGFFHGCFPLGVSTYDYSECCLPFQSCLSDSPSVTGPTSLFAFSNESKTREEDAQSIKSQLLESSKEQEASKTPLSHDNDPSNTELDTSKDVASSNATPSTAGDASGLNSNSSPAGEDGSGGTGEGPAYHPGASSGVIPEVLSDDEKTNEAILPKATASIGTQHPALEYEEFNPEELVRALENHRLWNCRSFCRMPSPCGACLEDKDDEF